MSTYNNGPGNIPQLPDRVVDTLIDSAGVSTYHPDGSQLGTLHALVHGVAEELLARLPTAPVQEAAAAAAPLTDITRITELMLDVAVQAAIDTGMLTKLADEATSLQQRNAMRQVLRAAFDVAAE
jgi:hypothetical protein